MKTIDTFSNTDSAYNFKKLHFALEYFGITGSEVIEQLSTSTKNTLLACVSESSNNGFLIIDTSAARNKLAELLYRDDV